MSTSAVKYALPARLLHWVSAFIFLCGLTTGFYISTPTVDEAIKQQISSFNVSAATILIPLFCLRVRYRWLHGIPAKSPVLMMKADFSVFGLLTMPHALDNPTALAIFRRLHTYSNMALAGSVAKLFAP